MNNKEFNEQRHNRKKQQYRFALGIQQLCNYPILNLIWVLFAVGVIFLVMVERKYSANIDVYPMFESIFSAIMTAIIIIFPILCAIGIVQLIKREFYTTIPMERWQEKKEAICDRLDVHLIGDITYGGRKKLGWQEI